MNRISPPVEPFALLVEALEPRIAPAGLLNESKFTSVVAGGTLLLDASDPNGFQGLSTGFGANSGGYLLYVTAGKALIFTSDLNGDGRLDANEITGIAAGKDAQGRPLDLISFTNINGDIVTNLLPGTGVSSLTDSDNDPNNGRDGRVLLDNGIHSITLRSLTSADIDTTIPGNTVFNRLVTTNYSIFGNIYTGGDFGASNAGLTIDTSGSGAVFGKFLYRTGTPQVGDILTGTAASNQHFRFTVSAGVDVQNTLLPFTPQTGEHGADIIGVKGANAGVTFDIGTLATGNGGLNARGGNFQEIVLHGDRGGYKLLAGDGGQGATGAVGGSIINFNDLGTITSEVILHTGNGGAGLLGAGGQGGTATFASTSLAANLRVVLGDGGNGFSAGGSGASQPSAIFNVPETSVALGGSVLGTYHANGDVGTMRALGTNAAGQVLFGARAIDFNGDGFGDAVYTSTNPDQIVIVFGDGTGNFSDNTNNAAGFANAAPSRTIYLDAPGVSTRSITVGDFNGDGRLDIAAASADANNAAGISVFLNQIGDSVRNPLGGRLIMGNPLGDHPFSNALRSPLPILTGGFGGSNPIFAIAAGDFNGDGITDLGVGTSNTLTFLFGDTDANALRGNGYFYAKPAGASPVQFVIAGFNANSILKASTLSANSGAADILFYSNRGSNTISELGVVRNPITNTLTTVSGGFGLGSVDTNRNIGQIARQNVTLQDFTLQDINADGLVDIAVLSRQPIGFLTTYQGDGTGLFDGTVSTGGDNGGIVLVPGLFSDNNTPLAIVPIDQNIDGTQDGIFNQLGILLLPDTGRPSIREISLETIDGVPDFYASTLTPRSFTLSNTNGDATIIGLGNYYAQVGIAGSAAFPLINSPATGYGVVDPNTDAPGGANVDFFSTVRTNPNNPAEVGRVAQFSRYLTDNGVRIFAGQGGNSTAGVGGAGGSIGSTASTTGDPFGNIQIILPSSQTGVATYRGQTIVVAGDGGDGFGGGGKGGDVQGLTVAGGSGRGGLLSAGNGGDGIGGDGGRGGNLAQFTVNALNFFTAGNGGSGLRGGLGGSVIGNQNGVASVQGSLITAVAGIGGVGALGGGNGGDINQFTATYTAGGSLLYISGRGGSAAGGNGGNGGGIINSSPSTSVNLLSGNLSLQTGVGGNGLIGGDGGAITNFVNQSTSPNAVPSRVIVITGNGGAGVVGQGGAGGAITNFRSNTVGQDATLTRIIAGTGGASYGSVGGVGGSVVGATTQSAAGAIAVIAGAGGSGLLTGGDGGSVNNSTINSAAQTLGKVLVIAGAGGDATAVSREDVVLPGNPDTQDLAHAILSFGGASGIGGNGGNITNFVQPVSVQTSVDLIAGNGGSTINAGSTLSTSTGVGRGGSVVNAVLTGTVGASTRDPNTNLNPPIRSYTDTDNDGDDDLSIAAFVQSAFAGSIGVNGAFIPANPSSVFQLVNASGNVGIVAGISGQVKGGQPARDGVNGSVQNITAGSIMSIIAGSVNSVSPVASLSGISVRNLDGVLGADKSLGGTGNPNNLVEYAMPVSRNTTTGVTTFVTVNNLQPGYRLIDGAIYTQNIVPSASGPILSPRVFVFSQG